MKMQQIYRKFAVQKNYFNRVYKEMLIFYQINSIRYLNDKSSINKAWRNFWRNCFSGRFGPP